MSLPSAMDRMTGPSFLLLATVGFILLQYLPVCCAEIRHLALTNETRRLIFIERLRFMTTEITVSNISWSSTNETAVADQSSVPNMSWSSKNETPAAEQSSISNISRAVTHETSVTDLSLVGFFLTKDLEWLWFSEAMNPHACAILQSSFIPMFTFSQLKGQNDQFAFKISTPFHGYDKLVFANCLSSVKVSADLAMYMFNQDQGTGGTKAFLSAELLVLYFTLSLVYAVVAGVWSYYMWKQKKKSHPLHVLLGILFVLHAAFMFFLAEENAYTRKTGVSRGWDDAGLYIFVVLRGIMLITLMVVVGTLGWSSWKSYFPGKLLTSLVILLQVPSNIAIAGIVKFSMTKTWVWLLVPLDLICCLAILYIMLCSIGPLREIMKIDKKAGRDLVKLLSFLEYYILATAYMDFTGLLVALSGSNDYTKSYKWTSDLSRELAFLGFYSLAVYKLKKYQQL